MYDYDSDVAYEAIGTKVRSWTSGDKRYTETSYFDVGRSLHVNYEGIPVDASIAMEDGIMDLMEPYNYKELMQHDNKYLSGFDAETYNMPPNEVEPRAQAKAEKANRELGEKHPQPDIHHLQMRDSETTTDSREQSSDSCRCGYMSTVSRAKTISSMSTDRLENVLEQSRRA